MRVSYCAYELNALNRGQSARVGALIKVKFADDVTGFADLHPWPELGDLQLEDLLAQIQSAHPPAMVQRCFALARADAEARRDRKSLFAGLELPQSHYLIADLLQFPAAGVDEILGSEYTHVKVKMGRDLPAETAKLREMCLAANDRLMLRIDFNQRLSLEQFNRWAKANDWLREVVDYIEDPFAYSPEAWRLSAGYEFALDRAADPVAVHGEAADVVVVKPDLHDPLALAEALHEEQLRYVLTNNLGHPVGHAAALWQAANFYKHFPQFKEVCGLQGLQHYARNDWTSEIEYRGPQTLAPQGTGLGFDTQLEAISWKPI